MTYNLTEKEIWEFVSSTDGWYWIGMALLAVGNLWNVLRLAQASTLYGRIIRVTAMSGFVLLALSPRNTGLFAIGLPLVLLSYMGLTHQLRLQCIKMGKIPTSAPAGAGIGLKAISMLVEHPK